MPTKRESGNNRPRNSRGYVRLERQLSLLAWLHHRLGYSDTQHLLEDLELADEGFDPMGRSHIFTRLTSRAARLQGVTSDELQRYDDNIHEHLTKMNSGRSEPITLRYFQYLAALYTEIYLDHYTNRRETLLHSLNKFVTQHNSDRIGSDHWELFTYSDLDKLAFWMATGSGKTLLLHLNYHQFLFYNRNTLDNILLITPNEGLSEQHVNELLASHIPAVRLDPDTNDYPLQQPNQIKVTEITKLVLEKKGEGDSVPIDALEGSNLIFVDEGHKGSGGEVWLAVRDYLSTTGFTFEYSATFGQALAAAKNYQLLTEYGKTIGFDYSYRHFYHDGYGKDFRILNLRRASTTDQTDTLLLANLLSFYEQQLVFEEREAELRPYNLSRPLWTFVGGSVKAVYQERGQSCSDILTVVRFLHRVLSDPIWATATIERLLQGESGLMTAGREGRDLFVNRFGYLRRRGEAANILYQDSLAKVMHTDRSGGLELCDLRGVDGELGLRAAGNSDFFGVIYIGDTTSFKKLTEEDNSVIVVTDAVLQSSLFDRINELDSTIEVLVGSRKFIEGWNSWRVSNMGLLNIGRAEGSQIIQLFGRGVRLRGRNMSLKRSSAQSGEEHPKDIQLLETLNIFALRADYMTQFRSYLDDEGVDTDDTLDLPMLIQPNQEFLNKGLVIPRIDEGSDFAGRETVLLQLNSEVRPIYVNMSAQADQIASNVNSSVVRAQSGVSQQIPMESLDLVDWGAAYLAVLEYKQTKRFSNLLIQHQWLRPILVTGRKAYRLEADEVVFRPRTQDDQQRLQEAVINILRKYMDALYRHRQALWESNHMTYRNLDYTDPNFQFNINENGNYGRYVVRVQRENEQLALKIERLIADCNTLYRQEQGVLARIHFDRHLYQPLLVRDFDVTSTPPGLLDSERDFVRQLRSYCKSKPSNLPANTELYLLRNLSRGTGVGFFESYGFYPDFILWVKSKGRQRIVFVEPHGMIHEVAYAYDQKARLHEKLPDLAEQIASRSRIKHVELDSFIVSATPYDRLQKHYGEGQWSREDFANKHILFTDNGHDYLKPIIFGDE